jgi:hypothetical protein
MLRTDRSFPMNHSILESFHRRLVAALAMFGSSLQWIHSAKDECSPSTIAKSNTVDNKEELHRVALQAAGNADADTN